MLPGSHRERGCAPYMQRIGAVVYPRASGEYFWIILRRCTTTGSSPQARETRPIHSRDKLWLKERAVFISRPEVAFDARHVSYADLYVGLLSE